MKERGYGYWIGSAVVLAAACIAAATIKNEYYFYAAYIVIQFVVLAGLGSMSGTLAAGIILGVSETIVLTLLGASWAPAVSFGLLLVMLGIRPQGLFGR